MKKIDEAFVPSESLAPPAGREVNMVSVSDMKSLIKLRLAAPKIAQWDSSSGGDSAFSQWSESGKSNRDLKVLDALYGVTTFDHGSRNISQAFLPGLEVLQESGAAAAEDHKSDQVAEEKAKIEEQAIAQAKALSEELDNAQASEQASVTVEVCLII